MGERLFFVGRFVRKVHRQYVRLRDALCNAETNSASVIHVSENGKEDFFVRSILAIFRQRMSELDAAVDEAKKHINDITLEIERLNQVQKIPAILQKIGARQTELKRLEGALNERTRERDSAHQLTEVELRQYYREIMEIPRLVSMSVFERRIEFRTDALFGRDKDNTWRRIGPFDCSFDIMRPVVSSMRWTNLDGERIYGPTNTRYHGPPNICVHSVFSNIGSVNCAGDGRGVVDAAALTHHYPIIVKFMIRYPECAGDPKKNPMSMWPQVDPAAVPPWYIEQFGK